MKKGTRNSKLSIIRDHQPHAIPHDPAVILQQLPGYLEIRDILSTTYPNQDGSKIVGINTINALHSRQTKPENGQIKHCIVSGECLM